MDEKMNERKEKKMQKSFDDLKISGKVKIFISILFSIGIFNGLSMMGELPFSVCVMLMCSLVGDIMLVVSGINDFQIINEKKEKIENELIEQKKSKSESEYLSFGKTVYGPIKNISKTNENLKNENIARPSTVDNMTSNESFDDLSKKSNSKKTKYYIVTNWVREYDDYDGKTHEYIDYVKCGNKKIPIYAIDDETGLKEIVTGLPLKPWTRPYTDQYLYYTLCSEVKPEDVRHTLEEVENDESITINSYRAAIYDLVANQKLLEQHAKNMDEKNLQNQIYAEKAPEYIDSFVKKYRK